MTWEEILGKEEGDRPRVKVCKYCLYGINVQDNGYCVSCNKKLEGKADITLCEKCNDIIHMGDQLKGEVRGKIEFILCNKCKDDN